MWIKISGNIPETILKFSYCQFVKPHILISVIFLLMYSSTYSYTVVSLEWLLVLPTSTYFALPEPGTSSDVLARVVDLDRFFSHAVVESSFSMCLLPAP